MQFSEADGVCAGGYGAAMLENALCALVYGELWDLRLDMLTLCVCFFSFCLAQFVVATAFKKYWSCCTSRRVPRYMMRVPDPGNTTLDTINNRFLLWYSYNILLINLQYFIFIILNSTMYQVHDGTRHDGI